jgi:5-methylcytosine-specific restriction enzyme A
MERPYIWKMIKEAVENINGIVSYPEIKEYIKGKWTGINQDTITDQIIVLTVNHNSRIHYPENYKPRLTNSHSPYDLLFKKGRGKVEKYNPDEHGVWEIYKDENGKLRVQQFSVATKIYTPTDIVWIKNVTNNTSGEAYLDLIENIFVLHFPTIHKPNVLSPQIDELILIRQKVNGTPAFTHIVTPIDSELIEDITRPEYRYGRRVKIIAKTDRNNIIPVSSTLWKRLNFAGVTQGNACKIENITNIGNIDELQFDIWQKFIEHFVLAEQQSVTTTSTILTELETSNPDLTVKEGELRLVSHLVKERNRKIIAEKKQQAIRKKAMNCEVCTFSFLRTYNSNFIECHHLSPIGQAGIRKTTLADLALVCANCHRMLHMKFNGQYLTIKQLKERIESLKTN